MINAGISLYSGCSDSIDLEQQLHLACANTEPIHPRGLQTGACTEQWQASASPMRGSGALTGDSNCHRCSAFWISPLSSLISIEIKSKCL